MMQVVKNHKSNYTSGKSTWSRGRSFNNRSNYKIEKYQEALDVAHHLKGIIEEENRVGGAYVLHFDMLHVP